MRKHLVNPDSGCHTQLCNLSGRIMESRRLTLNGTCSSSLRPQPDNIKMCSLRLVGHRRNWCSLSVPDHPSCSRAFMNIHVCSRFCAGGGAAGAPASDGNAASWQRHALARSYTLLHEYFFLFWKADLAHSGASQGQRSETHAGFVVKLIAPAASQEA